jgi:hypothetical protein
VAQNLLSKLSLDANAVPNVTLKDGLLRHKSKIWVGNDSDLQQQLIVLMHASPLGGHSGILVTHRRLKQLFYWKGMKSVVHNFVQNCQTYFQAEPNRACYPRKLQQLPVPNEAWEIISMDFIEGLPRSCNANCILVLVDKFTRYGNFIPLSHPYTASSVAPLFMNSVYKLHGLPASIISDRDPIFTSTFWK